MAVPGLYIPIRGDYSQFQQDMNRVAGIARENAKDIAEALNLAISPDKVYKGLKGIGSALKQLTAAAQSTGKAFYAPIRELDELAKKANVASGVVEELHYAMINTARDHQIEQNLRAIQKQCGLTEDAVARLQAQMGDTAGSIDTAMKALGVRSAQAIQKEIRSLEASFDHALKHGGLTVKEQERLLDAYARKVEALNREMGVMPFKSSFAQARETLGIRETGDVRAEAQQARQAYEVIQQSAWKTREMSVASHEAMIASLKKLAQELRLTASETSKFIAAFAGSRDALDSAMGAMGLKSTRAIKQEIAEVNRLLHRVESSASATLEDKERALAWAAKRTDALTREMRAPGQLTANERYEQATGLLGMKTDSYYRQQAKAIAQAYLEVRTNARSSAEDVSRAHAKMVESFRQLRAEMTAWKPQTQTVDPAKILGVRTNKEIYADIAALQQAFMQFSLAPGRAADEVERAKARMQTAIRELYREMGVVSAQDKRDGFLKLLGIRSIEEIEKDKQALINAHRQIVDEFSKGIGGWSEQDLRNSLAARNAGLQRLAQEAGTWQAGARAEVSPLRQRYDTLASQVGKTSVSFGQYEGLQKAKEAVSAFQDLNGRLPRAREIREIAAATGLAADQLRKMRDAIDNSSSAFKALIGYAQVWLTFGFAHTAIDFVKTAMALEIVKVAFQAIYGTADMAQAKLDYVRQVSEQLGLSFLDTAEGAKKLFAAAAGTPVEKEVNMVFKAFSDMSAAMKLTGDETKGVFLALSQMISKGKVSAEELRQQLAERMPGAVNLFARSIGKTTQELDKMLQKGEVTLEHFLMFSREVQNTYGAGAIAAGGSLQAELNRLQNAWVDFKTSMTDTDTLASGIRSLTSVFKSLAPAIEFIGKNINHITAIGLAAWIGSSFAAGGKLNGVMKALGGTFQNVTHRMTVFNNVSATMATRATGATAAIGKLRAGIGALGSGILYGGLFAIAGVLLDIAFNAMKASRGFQDASKNMSEYVSEMTKSQEAMEKSNFSPRVARKMLLADTEKLTKRFDENYDKNTSSISDTFSGGMFGDFGGGSTLSMLHKQTSSTQGIAEEAHRQAGEFWKSFLDAVKKDDSKMAAEIQKSAITAWESGIGKSVESIGGALGADLNAEWGSMIQNMGSIYSNLEKYLQTFSSASTDAAKRLGFNAAQMQEDLKKLKEAAEKTDLGKALSGIQSMDKIKEALGDSTLAYDANAKAIVESGEKLQDYLNKLQTGANNFKAHQDALNAQAEAYVKSGNTGSAAFRELEAAQAGLEGEQKELAQQSQGLAQYITNCALAAGGSETAFRMMESLVRSMAPLFEQLGVSIETVIGKMRDFQIAAANAVYETAALSGAQAAEMSVWNAKAAAAVKKGDKKAYRAAKEGAVRADAENKGLAYPKITPDMETNWDREYGFKRDLITINESGKKGGRGGGGKRVDNTAEKWKSAEEGWRKKIADMQGQKDVQTLAKDFADMDKQLKGSSVDMKALKKDYLEAFSGKYANDLNKEILQLRGNEAELAKIDIEEKYKAKAAAIEGMAEEAKKLGVTVEDQTPKLAEYRKLLEGQAREQQLQKELPYYEKFSWFDGMKNEALAKQNELIAIQAEKMKGTIPDELIDRWRELEELQNRVKNGNDVLAGISLGAKKYALEMGNLAENVSDLVQKSFDDMADAFTDLVMTGKANFTDLANSIIRDLMRIAIKQAIIGPIANGIGSLFGGLFGGGATSSAVSGVAGKIGGAVSGISAGASFVGGHALGDVFTGLHGFSNQIVNRPTLFSYGSQLTKFAKGGVMGEAGPEAVMPLTRTASGHLGVRSDSSNAPIVNVVINNSTGQQASQQTKTDNQGNKSIEVMVGDMAAQQMMKTGTALNKAARSFSGVSQQVTRR